MHKKTNVCLVVEPEKTSVLPSEIHLTKKQLLDLGFFGSDLALARIKAFPADQLEQLGVVCHRKGRRRVVDLGILDLLILRAFGDNARIESISVAGVMVDSIYEKVIDHRVVTHKRDIIYKIPSMESRR